MSTGSVPTVRLARRDLRGTRVLRVQLDFRGLKARWDPPVLMDRMAL